MNDWLHSIGLRGEEENWTIQFTMSTTQIDNWLVARNKLNSEDVKIKLTAVSWGSWVIQLERKDKLYVAQWRENSFSIESEQIRYRKIVKWPVLSDISGFPSLIKEIECIIGIKFLRCINIEANGIDLDQYLNNGSEIYTWLNECADTIETKIAPSIRKDNNNIKEKGGKNKVPKSKYFTQKLEEEIINFKDFGFKLSVIQELMYNKELLKPKFDLFEFVDWYKERDIDLEEEGYEPIPEVTKYFKDLQIPKRLAKEITEIHQDGGNDIYQNLICFSQGWEDYWNIENVEDIKYFPNLKKVVLCYANNNMIRELTKQGIKVD